MSPTTLRCLAAGRTALVLAAAFGLLVGQANCSPPIKRGTKSVQSGESIQAAIDGAKSGDVITVFAGTYREQLTISTDGITLIGSGAILVAPSSPVTNYCSGLAGTDSLGADTQAGICVQGSNVVLDTFVSEHRKFISTTKRVKNVVITGFQVRNFTGVNIGIVAATNTKVTGAKLVDGQQYGLLSVGSIGTLASANTVRGSSLHFIGMCMDDTAPSQYSANTISDYYIALCVQTAGAQIKQNRVSNCCIGAFVDPGVKGAVLAQNQIGATNPVCAQGDTASAPASGIFVLGAVNTVLMQNVITGQKRLGNATGIAIYDDPQSGTAVSGTSATQNVMRNNDIDLAVGASGSGNKFQQNICSGALCFSS